MCRKYTYRPVPDGLHNVRKSFDMEWKRKHKAKWFQLFDIEKVAIIVHESPSLQWVLIATLYRKTAWHDFHGIIISNWQIMQYIHNFHELMSSTQYSKLKSFFFFFARDTTVISFSAESSVGCITFIFFILNVELISLQSSYSEASPQHLSAYTISNLMLNINSKSPSSCKIRGFHQRVIA